jgi:hypothetical protein
VESVHPQRGSASGGGEACCPDVFVENRLGVLTLLIITRRFFYPRAHSNLGFGRLPVRRFSRCISMSVLPCLPQNPPPMSMLMTLHARQTQRSNFLNSIDYLCDQIWSCARRRCRTDPLTSGGGLALLGLDGSI